EFLSPCGVRSLSKVHREHPFRLEAQGASYEVAYTPGESDTGVFGGNSNWRGPVWLPVNYLLIEALERYHHFYGDDLRVECPVGSGKMMHLGEVAAELGRRVVSIFLPDAQGRRPCNGALGDLAARAGFRDQVHFYEYFHGDTGTGLGASHQTGWTALVSRLVEDRAKHQAGR
ncbi:MAG: MGH1-like glycoside hydrolase domain-containing protein, partial [Polyangiaceae bacterium]